MKFLIKLWNILFKRKKTYHKLVVEVDESIKYLMAREIILGINSDILIHKMKLCESLKSLYPGKDEYIVEANSLDFFEYKYYLQRRLEYLEDAHLREYLKIPFRIRIYYNPEEKDLDKYDYMFNVVLERAYHTDYWHVEKCSLTW